METLPLIRLGPPPQGQSSTIRRLHHQSYLTPDFSSRLDILPLTKRFKQSDVDTAPYNPYTLPGQGHQNALPPKPIDSHTSSQLQPTSSSSTPSQISRQPQPIIPPTVTPVTSLPRKRRDLSNAPTITREQAPNLFLNYIVSLHRPAVKKKHPSALYEYTPLEEVPSDPPVVRCSITLPIESAVDNRKAVAEGSKIEAKLDATRTLLLELWACGEVDDSYAPILDPVEEARMAAAAVRPPGLTAVRVKTPNFWKDCSNDHSNKIYPILVTFPPVLTQPTYAQPSKEAPDQSEDAEIAELEKMLTDVHKDPDGEHGAEEGGENQSSEDSQERSEESWTPRSILILTRLPMPHVTNLEIFVETQRVEVTLTHYSSIDIPDSDTNAMNAYSLRLLRVITNRPLVLEPEETQLAYFFAPVSRAWWEQHGDDPVRATKRDRSVIVPDSLAPTSSFLPASRSMIDWEEIHASDGDLPVTKWSLNDPEAFAKETTDAMACGKSEFSRRYIVKALRRDLSPLSNPADSPVSFSFPVPTRVECSGLTVIQIYSFHA